MVDGKPRIGDEVYIHGYIDEIRNDVIIIRNEGGYFGTSDREIFYYEEDERGYGTMNEADRKTENSSEIPNNCEDEPNCEGCKHFNKQALTYMKQCKYYFMECKFEPKDEPQTEGILFKGNLKEGNYKLIKTTNGLVLEGNDIAYYGEPQTERSE